jgi:hypothetical protein
VQSTSRQLRDVRSTTNLRSVGFGASKYDGGARADASHKGWGWRAAMAAAVGRIRQLPHVMLANRAPANHEPWSGPPFARAACSKHALPVPAGSTPGGRAPTWLDGHPGPSCKTQVGAGAVHGAPPRATPPAGCPLSSHPGRCAFWSRRGLHCRPKGGYDWTLADQIRRPLWTANELTSISTLPACIGSRRSQGPGSIG